MRAFLVLVSGIMAWTATTAWGQYGLYGSPEMLRLSQMPQASAAGGYYPATRTDGTLPGVAPAQIVPATPAAPALVAANQPVAPQASYAPAAAQPYYAPAAAQPTYASPAAQPSYAPQPARPNPALGPAQPNSLPALAQPSPWTLPGAPAGPPQGSPGVVGQMLQEEVPRPGPIYGGSPQPGCYGGPAGAPQPGFYNGPTGAPQPGCYSGPTAAFSHAAQGEEGYAPACCGRGPWYASILGLYMGRGDTGNRVFTTFDANNQSNQVMHTGMDFEWRGGGEIRFGRRFCCGAWAVEADYWTLAAFTGTKTASGANLYATTFDDTAGVNGQDKVRIGGVPVGQFFDNTTIAHQIERRSEVQSVEINVIRSAMLGGGGCGGECGCGCPYELSFSLGPRFFRFEDTLQFESWNTIGNQSSYAFLRDRTTNNLWGVQVGIEAAYYVHPRLRLFVNPKAGIYDNHVESQYELAGSIGGGAVTAADPRTPGYPAYPVNASRDSFAFLGQIDLGLDWNFACNWSARLGYRVVAATDVALPEAQIPHFMTDTQEISYLKNNGDLILHGAFLGVTYNF